MKIKCAWLYPDLMDLYGDKGNIMVLKTRAEKRGIEFDVDRIAVGDGKDLSDYDLIFLGGGADKEQMVIYEDLLSRKEAIKNAMLQKAFILLICGGYQLFGQYYQAADGSKIPGLGFFDYYTVPSGTGKRCIGNVIIDADLDGHAMRLVGFENHSGQTKKVLHPLGKVLYGQGNAFDAKAEGYYNGQVLGTYLHGPLLPKNSELADFILYKALKKNNPDFTFESLSELDAPFEKEARAVLFDRYLKGV